MTRCPATSMTQSQLHEIAELRVTTYDPPPQNCKYCSKLDDLLTSKQYDKVLRRIDMDRNVKITGPTCSLSQTHRLPREVECKSIEPYFRLPLHTALYYNAPYEIIKSLVEHYPGALKEESSVVDNNWLPLHMACSPRNHENLEFLNIDENREKIIVYLIDLYNQAVVRLEPESKASVMHLVCEHKPSKNLIARITKVRSDLARVEDCQGNIPLHTAFDYHAGRRIIKELLNLNPEGAHHKRKYDGHRPVHCAAFNNCSFKSLKYLLQNDYAEQAEMVNSAGETPLHLVFDATRYEDKWQRRNGNPVPPDCMTLLGFVQTLIINYAQFVYNKFGESQGVQKIVHLIKRKIDNQGNNILTLLEECDKKHKIPKDVKNWLLDIADEKILVSVPDSTSTTNPESNNNVREEEDKKCSSVSSDPQLNEGSVVNGSSSSNNIPQQQQTNLENKKRSVVNDQNEEHTSTASSSKKIKVEISEEELVRVETEPPQAAAAEEESQGDNREEGEINESDNGYSAATDANNDHMCDSSDSYSDSDSINDRLYI